MKTFVLWTASKAGATSFPYLYQLDFLRNHGESEVLERQLESLATADWNKDDSALTHNAWMWRSDCESGQPETHSQQKPKETYFLPETEPN